MKLKMKTVNAKWFECKVRYDKVQEDGQIKKVTESYAVDALSFTEAESRITEEIAPYTSGDFEITHIAIAAYKEVVMAEGGKSDKWYKAKVAYIVLDEKTGKESRSNVYMLVQGSSLNNAIQNVDSIMKDSMTDYVSVNMSETGIIDVFMHTDHE